MADINKVFLMGKLSTDVRGSQVPSGTDVCNFTLAITNKWVTKAGESKSDITYVEITVWGKQAANCQKYLEKGRSIMVEGHLKLDQWVDKETEERRSKLKVIGDRIQFLPKDGPWELSENLKTQEPRQDYRSSRDDPEDLPF